MDPNSGQTARLSALLSATRRTRVASAAWTLVLVAGCAAPQGGTPRVGELAPPLLRELATDGDVFAWVVREADLLACTAPLYELRHATRRFEAVPLAVVGVDIDERVLKRFLRTARIDAEVYRVTARQHRSALGDTPIPALYRVRQGILAGIWDDVREGLRVEPSASDVDPLPTLARRAEDR